MVKYEALAEQAADIAAQYQLRGSDAVYAAVALRFGSLLVTLDREQRERVATLLPTACRPSAGRHTLTVLPRGTSPNPVTDINALNVVARGGGKALGAFPAIGL